MEIKRHPKILRKEKTALLIVDIQEKILNVMAHKERVIENTKNLIKGMKILGVPIFYTEQYPRGLGETARELKELLEDEAIQKMSFSCSGAKDLFPMLIERNLSQIVLCGIESHVCIQQTALDLIANGFQVDLPADAVSSRRIIDYETALKRISGNGGEVTTTESILFELLEVCGTPEFKAISKLVK